MEEFIEIRNAKKLLEGELNKGAVKFVVSTFSLAGERKRYALSLVGDARTIRAALENIFAGKLKTE